MITYKDVLDEAAKEIGINKKLVERVYSSYWEFIRSTIEDLDLHGIETEEEFNKLRTNFNVPSLGKFYCTYKDFRRVKDKYNQFLESHKDDKDKES